MMSPFWTFCGKSGLSDSRTCFAISAKLFHTTLVGVISSVGMLCPNFQQFPSNITARFYWKKEKRGTGHFLRSKLFHLVTIFSAKSDLSLFFPHFMKRLTHHLYFWVLIAILSGGLFGYLDPGRAVKLKPL